VSRAEREVLMLDGQPVAEHVQIGRDMMFSADGRRLAYVARGERGQTLFIHSAGGSAPASKELDAIESPRFSPDSRRIACVARRAGRSGLLTDGVEGPAFDAMAATTLTWSADGRHVACLAQRGDKFCVAVDATETPAYDRVIMTSRVPFDSAHALRFLAIKGKQLLRVTAELPRP
jgi:hypothetical protein